MVTRGREEMGFGYRTSNIPEGIVVVEAKVILRRDDKEKITARVRELQEKRKAAPARRARRMRDRFSRILTRSRRESLSKLAKLKGRRVGDAQISDKHANFILNMGKANGQGRAGADGDREADSARRPRSPARAGNQDNRRRLKQCGMRSAECGMI